jgi:hypothetical protein
MRSMSARRYGVLDLLFAAIYAYVGFVLAPSRAVGFSVALGGVVGLLVVAGVLLVARGERGRAPQLFGILACAVLLLFALVCIGLLVASSAFLFGIYGALGRGIGVLALVAAALVIELCGLLPLFQLAYHLRARTTAAP